MRGDFTSGEASRLAGFEKRWMLEHLEREGTFVRENSEDRRHGRRRKYTYGDIIVLRAINRMLQLGARPARIRSAIEAIRAHEGFPTSKAAARQAARQLGSRLFIDKDRAFWLTTDEEALDLLKSGQLAFGFMISIPDVTSGVVAVIDKYLKKRAGKFKADEPLLDELCKAQGI